MGAKKKYYLVIRDKTDNEYSIIRINNRFGQSNRANKLEVIDDLTMHYKNKDEFVSDLYDQGYINNDNVDLFIVSPNSKGNVLNYFELVYNSGNKRDLKLKNIIDASLDENLLKEEDNIKYILDRFADLMNRDDEFNNIILFGYSNVPMKYINYFKGTKRLKPFYQAKFKDSGWAMRSYSLIRNIVDIIDRYDDYRRYTSNIFEENLENYKDNNPGRRKITNSLLEDIYYDYFDNNKDERLSLQSDLLLRTNKDYIEGQLTFDDYLNSLEFEDKIEDIDEKDLETKLAIVMDIFKNLPRKAFTVLDDNSIIFNTNMFLKYDKEEDKEVLSNLLSKDLLKDLEDYTFNLSQSKMYSPRTNDTHTLSIEAKHYESKIYNRLISNLDELNDAYSWCLLYNKCMEKDIDYRKKLGEDNGKVYDKYDKFKNEVN